MATPDAVLTIAMREYRAAKLPRRQTIAMAANALVTARKMARSQSRDSKSALSVGSETRRALSLEAFWPGFC
jgi:hypothetical protein